VIRHTEGGGVIDTNKTDDYKSKEDDTANTDQTSDLTSATVRTAGASLLPLVMLAMIVMQIA